MVLKTKCGRKAAFCSLGFTFYVLSEDRAYRQRFKVGMMALDMTSACSSSNFILSRI